MILMRASFLRAAICGALVVAGGCSGGSNSAPGVPPEAAQSVQRVTGTLQIARGTATASVERRLTGARRPDYVSSATAHAALFIDQASAPAGSTTSCTSSSCTISWSAVLNVPASHTFSVEIDDADYVLGEGQAAYALTAGTNSLATLSLNEVIGFIYVFAGACSSSSNSCMAEIVPSDYDLFFAVAANDTTTPVYGTPTSGDVFDNYNGTGSKNLTITSSNTSVGTVTGTSASPYASYASGTFTILGLNSTGYYFPTLACVSGATGTFGVTFGTGTPSGDITSGELSALSLKYPTVTGEGNNGQAISSLFVCNNGTISEPTSVTGTLPVN